LLYGANTTYFPNQHCSSGWDSVVGPQSLKKGVGEKKHGKKAWNTAADIGIRAIATQRGIFHAKTWRSMWKARREPEKSFVRVAEREPCTVP
jgi:hypothetical protein